MIPVRFADATELAAQLREIFRAGQTSRPAAQRPTRARTQRQAGRAAAAQTTPSFGAAGQPRFITDERTNSIILIAPAATLRQVERLVELLDYKRKGTGRIHVYRLQNADAEEMAQTLSTLSGGAGAAARPRPGAAGGPPQAAAVAELEGGIRITADAPTNSLIIQASAEGFATIRDVIEDLDLRRPQVMVEALIMEVDIDDDTELGAGFLLRSLMGSKDGRQFAIGSANPALSDPNSLQNLAGGPGNFATAILGKTITIINPDGTTEDVPVIQGLLTASTLDTDTNIISAPVLLTADNEEAQIVVGQNIPVLSSRVQTPDSAVEGAFNTSANIERQDIGVTLRVTPQISEGDSVRLEIFQEISSLIGEDPDLGPTTSNRQVEATVYVKDGESVMIGGILSEDQIETVNKVPWLGDIPILGWLFRGTSSRVIKTNLLVILTPHIVRDPEDIERLTIEQRERFRSAAGDSMEWDEEDRKAREEAIRAGIDIPIDPNPVRRELESMTEEYPTESYPELQKRHQEREQERIKAMEEAEKAVAGSYSVQVSVLRSVDQATVLLQELISRGYDGTLLSTREGDETLHSVLIGPFLTEDRAQQVAREIRAETSRSAIVVVEP